MLGPTRVDTNSLKGTAAFESFGVGVVRKSVVGDTQDQLVDEIRHSLDLDQVAFGDDGAVHDRLRQPGLPDVQHTHGATSVSSAGCACSVAAAAAAASSA